VNKKLRPTGTAQNLKFRFFLTTAEFAWFDKLTMSGRKPLTLSLSKGAAPSVPPR
jgi:hypothetical protein